LRYPVTVIGNQTKGIDMDISSETISTLEMNIEFDRCNSTFRAIGDGTEWKLEESMTDEEIDDSTGRIQPLEEMMANAVWEVCPWSESFTSPYLRMKFDLDELPFTPSSIKDFVEVFCVWVNKYKKIETDIPSWTQNRSGNPNFFDPIVRHGKPIVPEHILGLLVLKD
jgi:hypothetical protein